MKVSSTDPDFLRVKIDHNSLIGHMLSSRMSACFQGGDALPGFARGRVLSGCVR